MSEIPDLETTRRYVDPHSPVAARLLSERLGRLQNIGLRVRQVQQEERDGTFATKHRALDEANQQGPG